MTTPMNPQEYKELDALLDTAMSFRVQLNTVTPRMNELVKAGKAEEAFRDIYPKTNRRVIYWRPVKE